MRPSLPGAFLGPPLAHRALHHKAEGRSENSAEAIMAARDAGYGIEVDVQLTADGRAVVFHDDDLKRLTGRPGRVRDIALAELTDIPLLSGGRIPSLSECLDLVGGATALLVEIKDQDGRIRQDGPRQTEQLLLANGEQNTTLTDLFFVSFFQLFDEFMRTSQLCRFFDLRIGGIQPPITDVIANRAREQMRRLQHIA